MLVAGVRLDLRVEERDPGLPALRVLTEPGLAAELLQRVLRERGVRRGEDHGLCAAGGAVQAGEPVHGGGGPGLCRAGRAAGPAGPGGAEDPSRGQGADRVGGDECVVGPARGVVGEAAPGRAAGVPARGPDPGAGPGPGGADVEGPGAGGGGCGHSGGAVGSACGARPDGGRPGRDPRVGGEVRPEATLAGELDDIAEVAERLAWTVPALADGAGSFLARHRELDAGCLPGATGPAHHGFRPAQVLLHGGEVGFIDFDGAGMAEPALDLGRFRSNVRSIGIGALLERDPGLLGRPFEDELGLLDDLCEEFLPRLPGTRAGLPRTGPALGGRRPVHVAAARVDQGTARAARAPVSRSCDIICCPVRWISPDYRSAPWILGFVWSGSYRVPDGRPRPVMSKTLSRPARSSMPVQQAGRAVWAGFVLLGGVLVAFAVTTIPGVRSSPGFDWRFDGWLQCGGYVVAAAVAVARPATRSARRAPMGMDRGVLGAPRARVPGLRALRAHGPGGRRRRRRGRTPPGWPALAPCWWDCGCSAACMPRVGPRRWSWMRWWEA